MLTALRVRDLAVIEDAAFEPDTGLTVLTGETGAGKSLLVGALQLLIGDRASSELVRAGADRAHVQGTFQVPSGGRLMQVLDRLGVPLEDGLLIARREVGAAGRSRAFLNDVPVTVGALREVGELLVDLHGQHEHQSLLRPREHLLLLDAGAGLDEERTAFAELLGGYREVSARIEELDRGSADRAEKLELYGFQAAEIDALGPKADEMEGLEKELRRLEGAERLLQGVESLVEGLSEGAAPLIDRVADTEQSLEGLLRLDEGLANLKQLAHEARLALQELAHEARTYAGDLDLDPVRLERVRERHGALVLLSRKYGGSLDALLARRERIGEELKRREEESDDRAALIIDRDRLREEALTLGRRLSARRRKAAEGLQKKVEQELKDLAMSDAEFRIEVTPRESADAWLTDGGEERYAAGSDGLDRVEFLLATDPGSPVLPLQRVASGGEISRVMLAIKAALGRTSPVPTLVFDEIDSGIGGRTADRVGEKLAALAGTRQVLVITHLPQIARRGECHLVVEKRTEGGRARVRIRAVEGDERTRAVAVLMGGGEAGDAVLAHARELLGVGDGTEEEA